MKAAELFNIYPGEEKKLFLSLCYVASKGVCQALLTTIPLAIFLHNFQATSLPFVYIGSSLLVSILGACYSFFINKITFFHLLCLLVIVLLVPLFGLNILIIFTNEKWSSLFLLLWSAVVFDIFDLKFWGLMNRLYTLQQAKRLYGIIGAIPNLAGMITALSIVFFIQFIDSKILFLVSSLMLLSSLGIFWILNGLFPEVMTDVSVHDENKKIKFFTTIKNPYIRLLFFISFLTAAVYYFIDIAFSMGVRAHFITQDRMIHFLSIFLFLTDFLKIFMRILFFPISLHNLGIVTTGMLLPLSVFGIVFMALMDDFFSIWINVLFFGLIAASKLCEELFRSISEGSKLLMYQLLIPGLRIWVHSKIETIIWPLACVSTALMIISINYFFKFPLIIILITSAFISLAAIIAFVFIKKEYIITLAESIKKTYFSVNPTLPFEKDSVRLIQQQLDSPNPGKVIYCLDLLKKEDEELFFKRLPKALNHPSYLVKQFALNEIRANSLKNFYSQVFFLSQDSTQEIGVRADAILTLAALASTVRAVDISFDTVSDYLYSSVLDFRVAAVIGLLKYGNAAMQRLANQELYNLTFSIDPKQRSRAAYAIGELSTFTYSPALQTLLNDENTSVQRAAIEAIAKFPDETFYPQLLTYVGNLSLKDVAMKTCISLGEKIIPVLIANFASYHTELKFQILNLLKQMKIPHARCSTIYHFLLNQLHKESYALDKVIWQTLARLKYREEEDNGKGKEMINKEINREITKLSFLLKISHHLPGNQEISFLHSLLKNQIYSTEQEIYLLLSFYYPYHMMEKVIEGMKSSEQQQGYALELLQTLLKRKDAQKILPLILSIHRQKEIEKAIIPHQSLSSLLEKIAKDEDGYLSIAIRAASIYLLAKLPQRPSSDFFNSFLDKNIPLLQETAQWALQLKNDYS